AQVLQPSRQIALSDVVVANEDVSLLQYAYSDNVIMSSPDAIMPAFARQLRNFRGPALHGSEVLRESVLAWAALQLPTQQFGEIFWQHLGKALSYLRRAIES